MSRHRAERTCFPLAALLARVDGTSLRVFAELRPAEFCFVRRSTADAMLRCFFWPIHDSFVVKMEDDGIARRARRERAHYEADRVVGPPASFG